MGRLHTGRIKAVNIRKGNTSERDLYGARPFAANVRRRGCGIRSYRRLGRETTCGGRAESCVARSGASGESERVYRAHAGLQAEIPRPLARGGAHPAGAKAVLRVYGIQLRVVRERPRESVQHAAGQAIYLAAAARVGRAIAGLGTAELPHER